MLLDEIPQLQYAPGGFLDFGPKLLVVPRQELSTFGLVATTTLAKLHTYTPLAGIPVRVTGLGAVSSLQVDNARFTGVFA